MWWASPTRRRPDQNRTDAPRPPHCPPPGRENSLAGASGPCGHMSLVFSPQGPPQSGSGPHSRGADSFRLQRLVLFLWRSRPVHRTFRFRSQRELRRPGSARRAPPTPGVSSRPSWPRAAGDTGGRPMPSQSQGEMVSRAQRPRAEPTQDLGHADVRPFRAPPSLSIFGTRT